MNVYGRLFKEVRAHWLLAAGSIGFSCVMAVLELVPAALTRSLIDGALLGHNYRLLCKLAFALLAIIVARSVAYWARTLCTGILAQKLLFQIRTRLYEHLQSLSLSFFDSKRTGQIMSRVTNDVNVVEQFVVEGVRDMTVNVLKLFLIAGYLFYCNPHLTLLTLLPTVPLVWGTRTFSDRIRTKYRTMRRRLADMNAILSDTISGIRVVQVFVQEDSEADKFRGKSLDFQQAGLASNSLQAVFYPAVNFAFGIGQVIVWLVGGAEVMSGRLTTGQLIMFAALVGQFYQPVQTLSQMSNLLANTAASGERVYEILDLEPEIRTSEDAEPMADVKGEVTFDNVSFAYDSMEQTLQDVTLKVHAGETIGLVGPSGSGKSTLVSLISRFYDVNAGSVKIDGVDVRELDLKELRTNISAVLQDPYLFHGTIRENISYGKPDADFDDVIAAGRAANAHEFIMRLPDGYDSHVGERGTKLSGGERQRISIARAILDDPKILILDEATSSVDTESEVQIQTALDNLMSGRTTLAIAHRLSTVKNADKLVVMEEGRIVETGTHDELMLREESLYKRLVDMQSKLNETIAA